jgi:hypothetical protein
VKVDWRKVMPFDGITAKACLLLFVWVLIATSCMVGASSTSLAYVQQAWCRLNSSQAGCRTTAVFNTVRYPFFKMLLL